MKIKLFALMFGIMHGASLRVILLPNGTIKAVFLGALYNLNTQYLDSGPSHIMDILKEYYATQERSGYISAEINSITIPETEVDEKNKCCKICIYLKHKGSCPSSYFPFPNDDQGVNLFLESTLPLNFLYSNFQHILPLTAIPGKPDAANLDTTIRLCEIFIKLTRDEDISELQYKLARDDDISELQYNIDTYKLSPIDFIRKYPEKFSAETRNAIEKSNIVNSVTSFYEFVELFRTAHDYTEWDQKQFTIKHSEDQKMNMKRLLEIYFDDIEKQTEKINISDKYSKIIEEFIEEQKIDDNGNGVSYFEDILNKVNAGKASNEDKEIITAFWETCNSKNITNKVKMYFAIKAFWKKYNIDDNGSGLRQTTNKILDIFYGIEGREVEAQTECKETIDILKLIKEYALLDKQILENIIQITAITGLHGLFNTFSKFSSVITHEQSYGMPVKIHRSDLENNEELTRVYKRHFYH